MRKTGAIGGRGTWSVNVCKATMAANARWSGEGGSARRIMNTQMMFIPVFVVTLKPSFGDRADEAAAGGEVDVGRSRVFLEECELEFNNADSGQ